LIGDAEQFEREFEELVEKTLAPLLPHTGSGATHRNSERAGAPAF
jgi:hypothetical protein